MKPILLAATLAALTAAPAQAYVARLPADAVMCLSQSAAGEAAEATSRGVTRVPGCFLTSGGGSYERLSCSWRTCKARVWAPGSGQSAVVYLLRASLAR